MALVGVWLGNGPAIHPRLSTAQPNDNRRPAGRLRHDTLRVTLVVGMASWSPDGEGGEAVTVAAFSEQGNAPQIPGPLLRVPTGTVDRRHRAQRPDGLDVTVRGWRPIRPQGPTAS